MTRVTAGILLLPVFLVLGAHDLAAHGEATLRGPGGPVAAGEAVALHGSDFEPGEPHRLVLRGALNEYELRTVSAGADSTFAVEVTVPAEAAPGRYRVVALAGDGDEVATFDLPVTAAGSENESASETGHEGGALEARADEMPVERTRAGIEWGIIGLVIGLAGGLGVGLLRRG